MSSSYFFLLYLSAKYNYLCFVFKLYIYIFAIFQKKHTSEYSTNPNLYLQPSQVFSKEHNNRLKGVFAIN